MRWYKHFSDALDDPFIQELMDEFGHAGYVAWFGLLEIISRENGKNLTGILDIKPQFLKRKMRISPSKLKQIYEFCSRKVEEKSEKSQRKPKLVFDFSKEKWHFENHKILELKDNYTKDLQATNKKHSNHKEAEEEKEVEEDNKKTYVENSKEFRLAKLLSDLMLKNNQQNKTAKNAQIDNYQKWSDEIRKINQLDKRDFKQIEYLINWGQRDGFWLSNIQSPKKLREQFDTLILRAKEAKEKRDKKTSNDKIKNKETRIRSTFKD